MESLNIGVLGCGYISEVYLESASQYDDLDVVACADIETTKAEETADRFSIPTWGSPEAVIDNPDVDAVLNLTPPAVHAETSRDVLAAGKHLYTEKPMAHATDAAGELLDLAREAGLSIGCAPDMFLSPHMQHCRNVIDDGRIGTPVAARCVRIGPGHEYWHPNPDFYYREGGGPLLDFGPYYLTPLISFFGPVETVSGMTTTGTETREVSIGPRTGDAIDVEIPTHETGTIAFESGPVVTLTISFEAHDTELPSAPASTGHQFEIYGTEGALSLPDPSKFDEPIQISTDATEAGETARETNTEEATDDMAKWESVHETDGWETLTPTRTYTALRGMGMVDLAMAIRTDWEQRASGELGHHTLEILESLQRSAENGERVTVSSRPDRPAPLPDSFDP